MSSTGASTGSILNGAFRPFKDQPVTVGIWIAMFVVYGVTVGAWALGQVGGNLEALRMGQAPAFEAMGFGIVMGLLGLVFAAVMSCAVYRAVLRPEEGGFAWLRLGKDEFRMLGLYLIVIAACLFLALILGLFAFFLISGSALAAGKSGIGALIGMLAVFVLVLGFIYVSVRLSLIFALTFLRRRISIDEGWALAKGRFWTLFLAYLVIGLLVTVLQFFVPAYPGQGGMLATWAAMREGSSMQAMQAEQAAAMASMTFVSMLPYLVMASVVQAISSVLSNAAGATAVSELLIDRGDVTEVDADRMGEIFE